jgi:hypothetical protein
VTGREFGEEAQLVRAAPVRQLLFGERDRVFGKGSAVGGQYRATVAQGRAHQVGDHQQRALYGQVRFHIDILRSIPQHLNRAARNPASAAVSVAS